MLKKQKRKMIIAAMVLSFGSVNLDTLAAPFGGAEMEIENGQLQNQLNDADQNQKWNVWGNYYGGKLKQDFGSHNVKFFPAGVKSNYNGIQAGVDRKVGANFRVGGFVGYTDYNGEFNKNRGDLDTYSTYFGIYGTYKQPENGLYANAAVRVGSMKNEVNALIPGRTNNRDVLVPLKDEDHSRNWSVSFGAGKQFFVNDKAKNKEGFYLEPQASVLFGHIDGADYETVTPNISATRHAGVRAEFDGKDIGYLNLGTKIGYELKKGKNPVNVYGKIGFVYDFGEEQNINSGLGFFDFAGNLRSGAAGEFETDMNNHWWVFGIGVSAKVKERHSLHFDLETTTGGDTEKNWQLGAGYKYSW